MPEVALRQRALSLWQPWAWAVAAGHKRIENRSWRPKDAVGTWIAIHAGLTVDRDAVDDVRRLTGCEPQIVRGAIVGIAKLTKLVPEGSQIDCLEPDDRVWFNGPWGWFFESAVLLADPIPCRGFQSLWYLAPEIRQKLAEAVDG